MRASMPQYVRTELRPRAFAIVWLEREPVNLMDLAMWQQLTAALEQLEANEVCVCGAGQSRMRYPFRAQISTNQVVWETVPVMMPPQASKRMPERLVRKGATRAQ